MPDYTSQADKLAAQRQQSNDAQTSELFNALLGQRAAAQRQQVQGQQEQALTKYKHDLGQKDIQSNFEMLKKNVGPGMGGGVQEGGSVSLTKPATNPAIHMQDQDTKAATLAVNKYNQTAAPLNKQVDAITEGAATIANPKSTMTLGTARTLALKAMGMNRYNQQEASAVLQGSAPSTGGKILGYFGAGSDNDKLTNDQINDYKDFLSEMHSTAKSAQNTYKQQALSNYGAASPIPNDNTKQRLSLVGNPIDSRLKDNEDKFFTPWQKDKEARAQAGLQQSGLKGLLNRTQAAPKGLSPEQEARRQELLKKANQ